MVSFNERWDYSFDRCMELKKTTIKTFFFYTSYGNYAGENAHSLEEFYEKVEKISIMSLEFHLYRGDFEKWFINIWNAKDLANKIRQIRLKQVKGEELRTQIMQAVSTFISTKKRRAKKVS